VMHFGDELEINDAGYLSRNNTNYAHWQVSKRFTDLPSDSRYVSKDWRWRISGDYNDHGQRLGQQLRIIRDSRLHDGSNEYAQLNINGAGADDLLTRGNGVLELPPRFSAYYEYSRPRKGRWGYTVESEVFSGGIDGNDNIGYSIAAEPTLFLSDAFNLYIGAFATRRPDWLVWQRDNLIGSFDGRETHFNAGFNWLGSRHELRLKLQAIGVNARLRQGYRVEAGNAIATDEPVEDFDVSNLGFQVRYRYELAPLSYVYVVYGRGGSSEGIGADESFRLLQDSFGLRDDEQWLIKFSDRFET